MVVDRAETILSQSSVLITAAVYKTQVTFSATVSTNDTVTISNITTIANAGLSKVSDGSNVTFTKTGSIITITQATLTDEPIVGWAYG